VGWGVGGVGCGLVEDVDEGGSVVTSFISARHLCPAVINAIEQSLAN